jgi:hypothetical protein
VSVPGGAQGYFSQGDVTKRAGLSGSTRRFLHCVKGPPSRLAQR